MNNNTASDEKSLKTLVWWYIAICFFAWNFEGMIWGGIPHDPSVSEQIAHFALGLAAIYLWYKISVFLGKLHRYGMFNFLILANGFQLLTELLTRLLNPHMHFGGMLMSAVGFFVLLLYMILHYFNCAPIAGILKLFPSLAPLSRAFVVYDQTFAAAASAVFIAVAVCGYIRGRRMARTDTAIEEAGEEPPCTQTPPEEEL